MMCVCMSLSTSVPPSYSPPPPPQNLSDEARAKVLAAQQVAAKLAMQAYALPEVDAPAAFTGIRQKVVTVTAEGTTTGRATTAAGAGVNSALAAALKVANAIAAQKGLPTAPVPAGMVTVWLCA